MSEFIVTACDWNGMTDACVVTAASIDEAAQIGATKLKEAEDERAGGGEVANVFVAPWGDERTAYRIVVGAERSELQCCGGASPDFTECAGHWATCDERPEGTGQPCEPEGPAA